MGVPNQSATRTEFTKLGNHLAQLTVRMVLAALMAKVLVTVENQLTSMLWSMPFFLPIRHHRLMTFVTTVYCAWGRKFWKRTGILSSYACLSAIYRKCGHRHGHKIRLSGGIKVRNKWMTAKKLGNAYPESMCRVWSLAVLQELKAPGQTRSRF